MNEQDIWELLLGGLFLATASFWATVHLAYRYAGDAGVTRFIDKYPSARRFAFWTRRWDVLTAAPLIAWVVAAIGAITLLSPAVGDGWTPQDSLRLIALVLGFILLIRIIPVAISEGYSDRIAAILLPVVVVITAPLFPLAWLVSIAETKLTRLFVKQAPDDHRPSSEDEIISLMDHADSDDLEESEREMIRSVLEFGETVTREIMTHRVNVVAFEHTATISECVERSITAAYSRFPVYAGSLDDVRGVVHVKDLLRYLSEGKADEAIIGLCNKVTFVPESMPIDDLFRQLRTSRAQLAVVVDEYGGTAGLVSMEDIIEELVGEIHDEYDPAENRIHQLADGAYLVDARESVHDLNEQLGISIPESDDYDSVGGYVFHELGNIPTPGERVENEAFTVQVHAAGPNRVHTVRIVKTEPEKETAANGKSSNGA